MPRNTASRGFTLIELLIAVAVIAILAAIALPSYQDYITRSRARTATSDLLTLATDLENSFQRNLSYTAITTGSTAQTVSNTIGWHPAQSDFFSYTMVVTTTGYDLTATGTGAMSGCVITLDEDNVRSATGSCKIASSW